MRFEKENSQSNEKVTRVRVDTVTDGLANGLKRAEYTSVACVGLDIGCVAGDQPIPTDRKTG